MGSPFPHSHLDVNESGLHENPYLYEIDRLSAAASSPLDLVYPDWELHAPATIEKPRPENETPLILVETEASMHELVNSLKQEQAIAVDLEHHSYRSYQGFTCLIQVGSPQRSHTDLDAHDGLPGGRAGDPRVRRRAERSLHRPVDPQSPPRRRHGRPVAPEGLRRLHRACSAPRSLLGQSLRHGPRRARAGLPFSCCCDRRLEMPAVRRPYEGGYGLCGRQRICSGRC